VLFRVEAVAPKRPCLNEGAITSPSGPPFDASIPRMRWWRSARRGLALSAPRAAARKHGAQGVLRGARARAAFLAPV